LLPACFVIVACTVAKTAVPGQYTLGGQIEFYISGGFAGIRQSLIVDDTGLIVGKDDKRGISRRGQLDPDRLAKVRAVFMAIDVEDGNTTQRSGSRCADCFRYTIKATIGGKHHRVSLNSTAIQISPYGEAVNSLSQILHETLSGQRK